MATQNLSADTPSQTRGTSAIAFTVCRYLTYALTFLRSILVARYLGPHLLGVLGFLLLVLQYLSYSGLGLQFALNIELATSPVQVHRESSSVALTLTAFVGGCLVLLGTAVQWSHLAVFAKYSFSQYAFIVSVVAALCLVQQVYTNIFRIYGRLFEIAVVEIFGVLMLLLIAIVFRGEVLIVAMLWGLAVSAVFALLVFIFRSPFPMHLSIERTYRNSLLRLGLPLLVYNASFYLITMVAQSAVSMLYPLEEMGYYTLASSIANAALLGFNSIAWIAYPIVLGKTHRGVPDADAARVTDRVNVVLGTGVFLLVFVVLMGLPVLFVLLPKFVHAWGAVVVLLLSQALLMSSYGYNCLALARREQMAIAKISILSVVLVGSLSVLAGIVHAPFIWVAVAVLAGSTLFSLFQARIGSKSLRGMKFRQIVPVGSMASVAICLAGVLCGFPVVGTVLGFVVYLGTNVSRVLELSKVCTPYIRDLSSGLSRAFAGN